MPSDRRHLLEQFEYVHVARKVVGVGSVGTRAWILLIPRASTAATRCSCRLRRRRSSVLSGFAGKSQYQNAGQRVVHRATTMQAASDIFLGWQHVTGLDGVVRDFYLRQLRDGRVRRHRRDGCPRTMALYGRICGATLARAHARSGDRIAIATYLGAKDRFDQAIADFARAYADQNERDYAALADAIDTGRLTAQKGI